MLSVIDYAIIFVYLAAMLFLSYKLSAKESIEGFFVNNRKTKTAFLIFTFLSSSIGMGVILGGASAGYETGISFPLLMTFTGITSMVFIMLFAKKIKRFGDKKNAHTIADFFAFRYSEKNRLLAASITLVTYFVWNALQFVALASLSKVILGIDFMVSLVVVSLVTIAYTAFSGIKSDFYTDIVHFWVMTIVLYLVMLPILFMNAGGFAALQKLPESYFSPFTFLGSPFLTILGLVLVIPYALSSMDIWQRIYAAESEESAKKALIVTTILFIPSMMLPGLIGMALFATMPGLEPDTALFAGMKELLPAAFLGLGLAGIIAAAMSTINTLLMVGSATFTKDVYKSFLNKKASELEMLKYARVSLVIFGIASLITAYLVQDIVDLFLAAVYTIMVLGPALVAGFVWKRATSKAAFLSVLLGFTTMLVSIPFLGKTAFAPSLLVSIFVLVGVSLVTKHSRSENVRLV